MAESMRHVAFFRNLNQGQRNSPSRSQLLDALDRSGATDVAPFQSNGTVVFGSDHPEACARATIEILGAESTWSDVAFVRTLSWLSSLVEEIQADPSIDPSRLEVSLFDEAIDLAGRLPFSGRRCTVRSGGFGFAVTTNEWPDESNATPTIERAIEGPATSRGLPTMQRLVERFAPGD